MKRKTYLWVTTAFFISSFAHASDGVGIRSDVERLLHRSAAEMNAFKLEELGFSQAKTPEQPWTSSYWPDAIGGIATRYQKKVFPVLGSVAGLITNFELNKGAWKNNNEKMKKKVLGMDEEAIARNLSPSEKYDLLMGDLDFSLTNHILDEIEYRFYHKPNPQTGYWIDSKGLASWNGICDGWTTASLHVPRPVKTVRVRGGTGQMITFYPDDLKALASHLFARANQWMNIERVGNRCRDKKPATDSQGRPVKDECRDIDAGLWHATVINRIGIDQRGFIIDIDNKTAVNNHPVYGYEISYFNPITGKNGSIYESAVPLTQVKDGKAALRNANATQLVGVQMRMDILNFDYPTGKETDSAEDDKQKRKINYVYDLELNDQGDILGGQFSNGDGNGIEKQPDMVWMLSKYQLAWSRSSMNADEGSVISPTKIELWGNIDWKFKGDGRIPKDWYQAHLESSQFKLPKNEPWSMISAPAPLAEMVYYLFDRAKN
jgi:hypothetical protein